MTSGEVWDRTISAGPPHHWYYGSYPGAKDRRGASRCSCSACTLANQRDLLLTAGRRPRLAELCALVERVRHRRIPVETAEIPLDAAKPAPLGGVTEQRRHDYEGVTSSASLNVGAISTAGRYLAGWRSLQLMVDPGMKCRCKDVQVCLQTLTLDGLASARAPVPHSDGVGRTTRETVPVSWWTVWVQGRSAIPVPGRSPVPSLRA